MKAGMDTKEQHAALLREVDRLLANGQRADAVTRLSGALDQSPDAFAGWIRLGQLLYEEQRYDQAVQAVQTAEKLDPLGPQFQRIQRSMQSRDFAQAKTVAEAMLNTHPGHPRAVFTLAHLALAKGDFEGAVALLEGALSLSPANLTLRSMQVGALEQSGAYKRALEAANTLVEIQETFDSLWGLITLLLRYGQNDEALAACDRAARQCAGDTARNSALDLVRGQIYRILGDRETSIAAFRRSLAGNPVNAAAWWGLADMKTYAFSPADREAITQLVMRAGLDSNQRSIAAFALAKAHEVDGDWAASMPLYVKANALQGNTTFDSQKFETAAERLVQSYAPDTLTGQAAPQDEAPVPIFIVGLPRSGSTLVEQILASHSHIEATVEQPTLPAVKRRAHLYCANRFGGDYLTNIGRLSQADLSDLGQSYLDESTLFRTGDYAFFTDKMPYNFEHIGLIHKILPDAVIIDVRRNPMDCGLSLFKQHFTQGVDYSYSLKDIGRYYKGYLKIMDHWDQVLPGKVLHVQYEDLVRSPERVIREILSHARVDFEPGCLDFHRTQRAIRTASSEQVRKPIYGDSIGVWKRVAASLTQLEEALGEETLSRFQGYL
jgi:tetratricopeptide (TPR) repeat protein